MLYVSFYVVSIPRKVWITVGVHLDLYTSVLLIFLISWLQKPSQNYESNLLDVFKLSIEGGINKRSLTIPHAFIVQLQGNFWTAKKKNKLLFFQRETCVTFQKKVVD